MEITITEKQETEKQETENDKATICLNMIVKNESHIIRGTLEMLCNKIQFDYWVICDTGSTDGTQDIITKFFREKGIDGELFSDVWTDFAHNRTLALNRAFGKTDLLLVFDADDEIHGNLCLPAKKTDINYDEYHLKFGSPLGTSYTRVLLINNKKKFQYLSVLHEFISCLEANSRSTVIEGDYFVVSGRSGSRSQDPKKYLNDALILEKAHAKALAAGDQLYHRYAFYCANSYKDYGNFEDAIKWYKITLNQDNWSQEKYVSCLYIYDCYNSLGQKEHGFFYLIEAFSYDIERVECLYPLLVHYACSNQNTIAYNYYLMVKEFFEQRFLQTNMDQKLFIQVDKGNFLVPYYMILVADKTRPQDFECVIKMFEIIFTKKQKHVDVWYLKNLLYNLQFFIQHVNPEDHVRFLKLANEYILFLKANGIPLETFDFLKDYCKYGIDVHSIFQPFEKVTQRIGCAFGKAECEASNNILFYVGFSDIHWNYSYLTKNAMGGSEKAVAYLTKALGLSSSLNRFKIYIVGDLINEELSELNITYLHLRHLPKLINETPFHTVVCSRYIAFLEMFSNCSFHQFYIWAHDTMLLPYGCSLNDNDILKKWSNYIDGCVCQTQWHANEYKKRYPSLINKTIIINNGIDTAAFPSTKNVITMKQTNKFIYTSRTERGLTRVLELWPQILLVMPDAELTISTYTKFPLNKEEEQIKATIDKYDSITHLGQLNTEQLYNEMQTAEYWLYPTSWPETSCITALEMLMSEVICLYYPVAGLTNTMDKYGIQIQKGNEIETLTSLTAAKKNELRANGKAYAISCSWENRAELWTSLFSQRKKTTETTEDLLNNKETVLFFLPFWYNIENIRDYFDSYNSVYNVIYTNNADQAQKIADVTKVIFVFEVSNEDVYNYFFEKQTVEKQTVEISILNTEPMNLIHRFENIANYLTKYEGIKVYDYSLSNIHILNESGFTNTHHLPYLIYKEEQDLLTNLKQNTEPIYDFGIISAENPVIVERRLAVVDFLRKNGYTVKVIQGFKVLRDKQIAMCRTLLNIHGSNYGEESKIFEHIRCDRLLAAGYKILSEECYNLSSNFIDKYADNLKIISYNDFFNLRSYLNLSYPFKITYGIPNNWIDVTNICFQKLQMNNIITIPHGDGNRTNIFSDPIYGTLKKIFIFINNKIYEYNDNLIIKINLTDNSITTTNYNEINNEINKIHSKLKLKYGSFEEELPEQKMVVRYLKGHEKVLEIGGNIGRNSLIIGHILNNHDNTNLVTLESNVYIAAQLIENRDLNNMKFHIETSALSKRKLIQQGWNTIVSDVLLDGYQPVNCITMKELQSKYNIIFDTLVLDCEGAFYYILMDMPEILDNINLIIMENDYLDINNKLYIDNILTQNNFIVDYVEAGGWGPCYNNFFEVWKRNNEAETKIERKIVDCVTFYNELEMLTYRLNLLYNIVDYFVIVEARQTFVGASKALYFDENKHLFEEFSDKIIHIIVDLPFTKDTINISKGDQWTNEKYQRNSISKGLEQIEHQLSLDDVIVIADLDEIPDPNTLNKIKTGQILIKNGISSLEQDLYYYNLNSRHNEKWHHAKVLTVNKYKELGITCEEIRFQKCATIVNGGWHLSYFGNTSFIKNKIENFAHQEYNSAKYTDTEEIQKKIATCSDLFGRDTSINSMTYVDIYNNYYLPPLYNTYLKSFYTISDKKRYQTENQYEYIFTNTWFINSEIKELLFNYVNKSTINKILEIGSYEGASACFFSDHLLDNQLSHITCVDPFSINDTTSPLNNTTKIHFYNNIRRSKNYNKVLVEEMYSTDFYKKNDKTYNFIYIDGSHLLDNIITDFNNCLQIIEYNGIIWMDDYGAGEITSCIDNLYEANKHCLQIIHKGYQIAFRKI